MAAHTPLPPNLRWGLAVFSSSLFINNKTWDSGAAHTYHPGTGRRAWWQRGLGGGVLLLHHREPAQHITRVLRCL